MPPHLPSPVPGGDPLLEVPSYAEHKARHEAQTVVARGVPRKRSYGCSPVVILLILLGLIGVPGSVYFLEFTELGQKVNRRLHRMVGYPQVVPATPGAPTTQKTVEVPVEKIVTKTVEKIVEVPVHRPLPTRFVASKEIDTAQLYGGLHTETKIVAVEGAMATEERDNPQAYQIAMTLNIRVPKPNTSIDALSALNPELPKILPDLGRMLSVAKVSGFYHELYRLKQERVQRYLTRFDRVPSRHNFFDCESVLELTHPETGGRALLMQGEMDVVSDGSDGDRWPQLDEYISMSDHYQPFTSYGWPKTSSTPNPLLAKWQADLAKYEAEYAVTGLPVDRNRFLEGKIATLTLGIADMKSRSFLIAEADPFIVVPISFLGRKDAAPFVPSIGDYAVIIYEDGIYPAIVGDAGPSYKMGEASLRVAKQLNDKAGVYSRPVSDLKVTYLVFPDSAEEKKQAPDLKRWQTRCDELLAGLGGLGEGYSLYQWEDLIAKRKLEKELPEKAIADKTIPVTATTDSATTDTATTDKVVPEKAAVDKAAVDKAAAEKAAADKAIVDKAAGQQAVSKEMKDAAELVPKDALEPALKPEAAASTEQ